MLKSLYPFKKTHPVSISFGQGALFIELPGAEHDKNWNYVVDMQGQVGYVPRNYVIKEDMTDSQVEHEVEKVTKTIEASKLTEKEKSEIISKISKTVKKVKSANGQSSHANAESLKSGCPSSSSHSCPKPSKKRAAPKPPVSEAGSSPRSSPDPAPAVPPPRRPSVADPTPDQLRFTARELVELVRSSTGLSHGKSQATAQAVLEYLASNLQRLDANVPKLIAELNVSVIQDKADVETSSDTHAIEELFAKLTAAKEDDQQRNWMLHEDESHIREMLQNLSNSLQNSDKGVCLHVMARFKYFYIHSLIEYYQMETRWSLRELLIENFIVMCSLDSVIISIMLSSVLPLELAQDLYQNTTKVHRMKQSALLLTIIFSRGESMPVHYFSQLGASFISFLLDYIEEPPSNDTSFEIPDVFLGLVLSYNLQFKDLSSNIVMTCLAKSRSAKIYTEKILLLLNREDDPAAIVRTEEASHYAYSGIAATAPEIEHSVRKVILDMFKHKECSQLFYTNDIFVLIDIIVRQLTDLNGEDYRRGIYLKMCQLVVKQTDYDEHLHRFHDLQKCFIRMLDEEDGKESDKKIILDICTEVSAFSSLLP